MAKKQAERWHTDVMAEAKRITSGMIQSDSSGRVKTIKPIRPRRSPKKKRNRREFNVFEDSGSLAPQTPVKRQRNASAPVTDLSLNNDADSPETKQMKKELLRT
jgi:hypothetical protein